MQNLELKQAHLSSWRKIALGTWSSPGNPSVYGTLEINASQILQRQRDFSSQNGIKAPTLTAIVAKAVALTFHRHPQLNGMIRCGKIYLRKSVSVFLQVAVDPEGTELSGIVIHDAEKKPLLEIAKELLQKASEIRQGKDLTFKQSKSLLARLPAFAPLLKAVLSFFSFILYTLNISIKSLGLPQDPFGSVMITSVGSLGLDEAFAPLVPYSRVPMVIVLGTIKDTPMVQNGNIVIAPIFKLCATFDHRFIDGVHASNMVKTVRRLLETKEGLDEIGL